MSEIFKPEFVIRAAAPLTGAQVAGTPMSPVANYRHIALFCTYTGNAAAALSQARLRVFWRSSAGNDFQALDTSGTLFVNQFRDLPSVVGAVTIRRTAPVENPGAVTLVVTAIEVGDPANPGTLAITATATE